MRLHLRSLLFMTVLGAAAAGAPASSDAQPKGAPPGPVARGPLATAEDHFFKSGDLTIHYRDVGSGEPVIVVHGWARTMADWNAVAEALAPTHRVIAIDVRGFGKSDKSGDLAQFGPRMGDDVVRLMDHLGLARANVAGQSMGALIAADVAARYPKRVSRAVLISGPFLSAPGETDIIADLRAGKGMWRMLKPLADAGMDSAAVAGMAAQMLAQNDVPSLIASLSSLASLRKTYRPTPTVPALVVCGTADPLLPVSKEIASQWKGAQMIEVSGATHAILGRPEVATTMLAFLGR